MKRTIALILLITTFALMIAGCKGNRDMAGTYTRSGPDDKLVLSQNGEASQYYSGYLID